jgi:hypothetical protein
LAAGAGEKPERLQILRHEAIVHKRLPAKEILKRELIARGRCAARADWPKAPHEFDFIDLAGERNQPSPRRPVVECVKLQALEDTLHCCTWDKWS